MSSVIISGDSSGTITLQAPAVSGSTTINLPATSGTATVMPTGYTLGAGNTSSFKNRIINGAMQIDQRNAGASVTPTTNSTYTLDRWRCGLTQSSKFSVQQTTTAPAGFINSLKVTSTSAYTVGSGDVFVISQFIEGLNIADLAWGTANAKTVTLSFQVYSSLTGTFGGCIGNSSVTRAYPFTYTISSANTWTTISVTIAGDTTGTWATTNSTGIAVYFGLGVGSTYSGTAGSWAGAEYYSATGATSVVGTNGATFYITGVQLEVGSTATSFDYRDYGRELMMCQRYYQTNFGQTWGQSFNGNSAVFGLCFPVVMRANPSLGYTGSNVSFDIVGGQQTTSTIATNAASTQTYGFVAQSLSLSNYQPVGMASTNMYFTAEL